MQGPLESTCYDVKFPYVSKFHVFHVLPELAGRRSRSPSPEGKEIEIPKGVLFYETLKQYIKKDMYL